MTYEVNTIHGMYRKHCVTQVAKQQASDSAGAQDVAAPSAGRSGGAPGTRSRGSSGCMCSGWSDSVLPYLSFSSVDVPCTQVKISILHSGPQFWAHKSSKMHQSAGRLVTRG